MIYCVSDLHACDRGPRDNFSFGGRGVRFNDFLDWVGGQRGDLMVLGDLLDWWQVNLSESVNAYAGLLDRLDALHAVYVVGNHDNALVRFVGTNVGLPHPFFRRMVLPFELEIGGRKFAFMHGHEVDPSNCQLNPGIGQINTIISGMLEDRNNGPFVGHEAVESMFIGSLESVLALWQRLTMQEPWYEKMVRDVEAYRIGKGADVVVSGHTHRPGNVGISYYNTGTWARQVDTFARIDDDGQVTLWQWKEGVGAVPFEQALKLVKEAPRPFSEPASSFVDKPADRVGEDVMGCLLRQLCSSGSGTPGESRRARD